MKLSEDIKFIKKVGQSQLESEYIEDENSFIVYSELPTLSLVTGHQYLSLEVECNNYSVIGVSGFFRLDLCKKKDIQELYPSENLYLEAVSEVELECGIGHDYILEKQSVFDPVSKRLLLGNKYENTQYISIGSNVIAGLHKDKIVCIQIENLKLL